MKHKIGFAPISVCLVFLVFTAICIVSALHEYSPQTQLPLMKLILKREVIALQITLMYAGLLYLPKLIYLVINRIKEYLYGD